MSEPLPQETAGQDAAWSPEGPPHHPAADRAYVLGLLAVVGSVFVLPLLLGPYVWHLGFTTRRQIDLEPGRWGGRRQATAGLVLGAVATATLAVLALAAVGVAAYAALRLRADTGY
jgi:hypothetical protein